MTGLQVLALGVALLVLVSLIRWLWPLRTLRYRRPRYRIRSYVVHSQTVPGDTWRVWRVWSMDEDDLRPRTVYGYLTFRAAVKAAERLHNRSPRRWEFTR